MVFIAGAVVVRDASGIVDEAVNGSQAFLDCANRTCAYGLQNSFQVIELVSGFGPIIYAGCFAATLSSGNKTAGVENVERNFLISSLALPF